MSDPKHAHMFVPNANGVCKYVLSDGICHLAEDAIVHVRYATAMKDNSISNLHDVLQRQRQENKEEMVRWNEINPPDVEVDVVEDDDTVTYGIWVEDDHVNYGVKSPKGRYDPRRLTIIDRKVIDAMVNLTRSSESVGKTSTFLVTVTTTEAKYNRLNSEAIREMIEDQYNQHTDSVVTDIQVVRVGEKS